MKLMTLNTHSLIEENYSEKLNIFVKAVARIKPDIIALQEVNQNKMKEQVTDLKNFYAPDKKTIVREDNHALNVVKMLSNVGINYHWSYKNIKNGYDVYDEGIAIMSLSPIIFTDCFTVSKKDDYSDWKTRKVLGIKVKDFPNNVFFSVHYGWWDDEDSFSGQWLTTLEKLRKYRSVWLMGDFNNPAEIKKEGYNLIERSGFYDSYKKAHIKDNGITVDRIIDGWRDRIKNSADGMRIDQIWSSKPHKIKSHRVIFNGENFPIISDHYGIIIEL